MPCFDWILIVMAATCMPLWTSPLWVNAQTHWINFETAAHFRELRLHFFNKRLTEKCTCFFLWKFLRITCMILSFKTNKVKMKVEGFLSLILTCAVNISHASLINFSKCFTVLHFFQKFRSIHMNRMFQKTWCIVKHFEKLTIFLYFWLIINFFFFVIHLYWVLNFKKNYGNNKM